MDKQETEIWRVLPSNENYLISDLGRVKVLPRLSETGSKLKGKMLKPCLNSGYLKVKIGRKVKQVHQLVAETFLNHVPCGHKIVVDHANAIKTDNRLSNLQLISNRENCSKDKKGGTSKYVGVSWHKATKKWQSKIQINGKRKHLGHFHSEEEAAKYYQDALTCVQEDRIEDIKVKKPKTTSKFKGVCWDKNAKKWKSHIYINGKQKHLGCFNSEEEASEAYQNALNLVSNG